MYVKTPAKVSGIPAARVASAPGVTDEGAGQVTIVISALDAHGFPTVVTSLRLSLTEARAHAAAVSIAVRDSVAMGGT